VIAFPIKLNSAGGPGSLVQLLPAECK